MTTGELIVSYSHFNLLKAFRFQGAVLPFPGMKEQETFYYRAFALGQESYLDILL